MKRQGNLLEGRQVRLTILGSQGWSGEGRVLQVNIGVLSLVCSHRIPLGAALRIDADDVLILGECRRCESDDTPYRVEVAMEQIIPSMSNLAKLVAAVCGVSPRRPAAGEQEPTPGRRAG